MLIKDERTKTMSIERGELLEAIRVFGHVEGCNSCAPYAGSSPALPA